MSNTTSTPVSAVAEAERRVELAEANLNRQLDRSRNARNIKAARTRLQNMQDALTAARRAPLAHIPAGTGVEVTAGWSKDRRGTVITAATDEDLRAVVMLDGTNESVWVQENSLRVIPSWPAPKLSEFGAAVVAIADAAEQDARPTLAEMKLDDVKVLIDFLTAEANVLAETQNALDKHEAFLQDHDQSMLPATSTAADAIETALNIVIARVRRATAERDELQKLVDAQPARCIDCGSADAGHSATDGATYCERCAANRGLHITR
jgi:hypothetical protein